MNTHFYKKTFIQKYGKEYFYDLDTIKKFFKFNYLCSAYLEDNKIDKHAIFLAKN